MNASSPETGLIRQITIQDVFAILIIFSVMCGFCELLSECVILRFKVQGYARWTPRPGILRLLMFFLVLPSGILVFSLQSGRKELRTGTYLNTYIGSILSVAFCHFMFVAPDSLVPMHTGITVVLVVHLGISLIFSFVEEQPFSLAVRVVLSLQAFAALALNSDLWVPRLAPFTIPLF